MPRRHSFRSSIVTGFCLSVDSGKDPRLVLSMLQIGLLRRSLRCRLDIERYRVDLTRKNEWRLIRGRHRCAVVPADIHARVTGEAQRDGVLQPARGNFLAVDEQ